MLQNPLVTFGAIGVAGLLIMILGFKSSPRFRRGLETAGAVVFHVGVFGILYHKVPLVLFVSLVSLVLSLFVLIDPLKLTSYIQPKAYRTAGLFLLLASVASSAMYFTNFPAWLWVAPLVAHLLPYAVPPLRKKLWLFHGASWLMVFAYLFLIGASLYGRFNPDPRLSLLTSWFDGRPAPSFGEMVAPETVVISAGEISPVADPSRESLVPEADFPNVVPAPEPVVPPVTVVTPMPEAPVFEAIPLSDGPFLKSLRQADEEFIKLKADHEALKKKYDELEQENLKLQKELENLGKGALST